MISIQIETVYAEPQYDLLDRFGSATPIQRTALRAIITIGDEAGNRTMALQSDPFAEGQGRDMFIGLMQHACETLLKELYPLPLPPPPTDRLVMAG